MAANQLASASEVVDIGSLSPHPDNPRRGDTAVIAESLARHGQYRPIVAQASSRHILAGNHTWAAARSLGWETIAVVWVDVSDDAARRILLADNRTADLARYDEVALLELLADLGGDDPAAGLAGTGWKPYDLDSLLASLNGTGGTGAPGGLAARWGAAPFSVLDARAGPWQERKRAWLALGIEAELGRDGDLLRMNQVGDRQAKYAGKYHTRASNESSVLFKGTSLFDPVLCELVYRWFCPEGGSVLDPFAGGAVRGIVADRLGRSYTGIDLSARQLEANRNQGERLGAERARWVEGDAADLDRIVAGDFDLLFSCPPYFDLERYSDDPRDLSAQASFEAFCAAHSAIIEAAGRRLADDRFAVWVVSEIRGPDGFCRGLLPHTISAFEAAGLHLYNEAVLVQPVGSTPIRAGRHFAVGRKLGRCHQSVLVFCRGDPRAATEACGDVVIDEAALDAEPDDEP